MNKIGKITNNIILVYKPMRNFSSLKPLEILVLSTILKYINNTKGEISKIDLEKSRIQHIDWREDLITLWNLDSVDIVNIALDIEEKIELQNPDLIFNLTSREDFNFTSPMSLIYYINEVFYNLEKDYPEIKITIKGIDEMPMQTSMDIIEIDIERNVKESQTKLEELKIREEEQTQEIEIEEDLEEIRRDI